MPWVVEKTKEIAFKDKAFTINVTNTGFNLLFEIYEHFFGRIFFGVNYWPAVKEAIKNLLVEIKKGSKAYQEVIVTGQKNVKLVLTYDKRKSGRIIISRMKSDSAGLTWILDRDSASRGSQYRRIRIPVEKRELRRFLTAMDRLYKMIEKGEIIKPKSEGFDLYYANEMARHDRSMLAFKESLDDNDFTFFLRLDENPKKSDKPYKIARAQVAKEAKQAGISFLPERRWDDGFITLAGENIAVDWEIRRDWVGNYCNIPIRFTQRKTCELCGGKVLHDGKRFVCKKCQNEKNVYYHAVEYPPPNPWDLKNPLSPDFDSLQKLTAFMEKKRLHQKKPYFIYKTLGQFGRKMKKKEIMLSIQCTRVSPQWPKRKPKTKKPLPEAFLAVAWHEDFKEAGTVTRTTGSGAGELGDYWDSNNYGIFKFNKKGVELFKKILKKQYSGGTIEDRNGNTIPRKRQWV